MATPKKLSKKPAPRKDPLRSSESPEPHAKSASPKPKPQKSREPEAICGANGKRNGKPCRHPAGLRTDHPGEGRCWLHGGLSQVKHGRYAKVQNTAIRELLAVLEDDPDPHDLLPEAQLLRALVQDYINRYQAYIEALTTWQLSFEKKFQADWSAWYSAVRADALKEESTGLSESLLAKQPDPMSYIPSRPLTLPDILQVGGFVVQIGGLVEKIRKARETQTFSMATIDRLWVVMSAHLNQAALEVVKDDELRNALLTTVSEAWDTINLAELSSRRAESRDPEDH